ncbi:MAG: hypothetical protein RR382_05420 [Tannerellaceae bacterium]
MEATINIDNYLSESEKKEYAIEAFKESVKESLFKGKTGVLADSEAQRILGNISHNIIEEMVAEYLPNYSDIIRNKVQDKIMNDDLSYEVFRKGDAWGGKESLAIQYINNKIIESKGLIQLKVEQAIKDFDYDTVVRKEISAQMDKISESFYKLNELFSKQ